MPQLWTETFVSQYFWLLLILLTFYYFITTKVIPIISESLKARQINEIEKKNIENINNNENSSILFTNSIKQDYQTTISQTNWDVVQNEWLSTNPENNNIYWTEIDLTEESKQQLLNEEDLDLTLEEFIQSEELK